MHNEEQTGQIVAFSRQKFACLSKLGMRIDCRVKSDNPLLHMTLTHRLHLWPECGDLINGASISANDAIFLYRSRL
jgi:hypothetical protein